MFQTVIELEATDRRRELGAHYTSEANILKLLGPLCLDELHAAILNAAMLPRLADWTTKRRQIAQRYLEGIKHPSIQLPTAPEGSDSVWHLFPLITIVKY